MNSVIRPKADKKKISTKNDFEFCYLRHKYIRRVDYNPTEIEMSPFYKIVNHFAKKTYYMYRNLFVLVGLELEDIVNIGKIHLVSFLGLFALDKMPDKYSAFAVIHKKKNGRSPGKEAMLNKNKANFTIFLKQRMEELTRICRQKARNIKGTLVEDYLAFYGPVKPPEDLKALIDDHSKYQYKKLDLAIFRSIKKKAKPTTNVFQFAGNWYVSVPLDPRNLTIVDFSGAGLDPRDSMHNRNPEEILFSKQEEESFDRKKRMFEERPDEMKEVIIKRFIRLNKEDPALKEEVELAKKFLRNLGT